MRYKFELKSVEIYMAFYSKFTANEYSEPFVFVHKFVSNWKEKNEYELNCSKYALRNTFKQNHCAQKLPVFIHTFSKKTNKTASEGKYFFLMDANNLGNVINYFEMSDIYIVCII